MKGSRQTVLGVFALLLALSVAGHWWGHRQQMDVGRAVAALASPGDLHMYSSDTCPTCSEARRWFQRNNVPFTECSIEREPQCRAEFDALRAFATPVIVVRDLPILGFDPDRLLEHLRADRGRTAPSH